MPDDKPTDKEQAEGERETVDAALETDASGKPARADIAPAAEKEARPRDEAKEPPAK